ncbi:MAG TPA: terminase family protein [Allosphingosinicella sp.]|jgi:phage terminase large subunit-like protein|nr:terminase family protein [Allosphingosinicella sp.]
MARIDYGRMPYAQQLEHLSLIERVALLPDKERRRFVRQALKGGKLEAFIAFWTMWARKAQEPPDGSWRVWLLMAGRGFGKTRAGAEWIHHLAEERDLRIALAGPSEDEVRAVMVEGSSGLLACAPEDNRPEWEPSRGLLTWPSGSRAFVYSGANPESLRGPEHDYAWCDEIAKWARAEAAWDNLMFGLRRGRFPRVLATTTPRPTPLMRRLLARGDVAKTKGTTAANVMLAESFVDYVSGLYEGTRLGRQELDGELIEDVEGALWTRALVEQRRSAAPAELKRVVVGVDPPATAGGDACGIVACGIDAEGIGYVLGDHSVRGLSPEGWAAAVALAAEAWEADRVVAENNQGGDMVESVLRSADCRLPVTAVRAKFGKGKRAEPVAVKFMRGRAKFAGIFPELEDELCGLTVGGGYEGPGRSPDRADAMVWAMAELLCAPQKAEPRVRVL